MAGRSVSQNQNWISEWPCRRYNAGDGQPKAVQHYAIISINQKI